jgi:methyl-accepting chemotaxis protein
MKLETKLGVSTGVLILAMFVSATVAHRRIEEANRLSATITEQRLPAISRARDVRFHMMGSVRSLMAYVLFGTDPASSAYFRQLRKASLAGANQPFADLLEQAHHFDLDPEGDHLRGMQADIAQFEATEEEVERLQELHTPEGTTQAYALLRDRILPMDSRLLVSLKQFVESQERQSDSDTAKLHEANRSVLITLWTATILGALLGGVVSLLLARRITRGIGLVSARANAIASGDLTNPELDVNSSDQIGALASAMQQMQISLGNIIRTVARRRHAKAVRSSSRC